MSEEDLVDLIARHNRDQWLWVGISLFGAALLWPISYGFAWWVSFLIVMRGSDDQPGTLPHAIASIATLILIADAFFRSRELFDLDEAEGQAEAGSPVPLPYVGLASGLFGYVVLSVLRAAPHVTAAAIRRLFTRLHPDRDLVRTARSVINRLAQAKDWTDASDFGADARSLILLDQLGLIWKRDHGGRLVVKIAPDVFARYFEVRRSTTAAAP